MSSEAAALAKRIGISLAVTLTLFGAIWDYGAATAGAELFWTIPQLACAGLVLTLSTADLPQWVGRWGLSVVAAFTMLIVWSALPLVLPNFDSAGTRVSPLDRYGVAVEFVRLSGLGGLFVCGYGQAMDRRSAKMLFDFILFGSVLYSIWAVVAFVQEPNMVLGLNKQMHHDRLTGSFLSANTMGSLVGALACGAGVRAFRHLRYLLAEIVERAGAPAAAWRPLIGDGVAMIVLWSTLLLTLSRTAIAVSILVTMIFASIEIVFALRALRSKTGLIWLVIGGAAGVVLLAASLVGSRLADKFQGVEGDAWSRIAIAEVFVPLLKSTPIFGYGLGGFSALSAHVITPQSAPALWNLSAAHNLVLQWWLEGGIVGLGIGVVLIGLLIGRLIWLYFKADGERWRAGSALAVGIVLLLHSMTDFPLQIEAVTAVFALLLGWGAAKAVRPPVSKRAD